MGLVKRIELQKNMQKEIFKKIKDNTLSMEDIEELSRKMPTNFLYKDNKNLEECRMKFLAFHYYSIGKLDKSIKYANGGLKINPKSPYLYYIRGRIKADKGLLEEGVEDLHKAIKLKPNFMF